MKKFTLVLLVVLSFLLVGCNNKQKEQEEAIRKYTQEKLELYENENSIYEDYEVDVAFLGDSLTDGYDVNKYFPELVVVNRGIGGDTTFKLEERLQISLYDLKPKVAVLLIGGNNLNTMFENYENILKGFNNNVPETKIILLSLTCMGQDWGRNNKLAYDNNVKIKQYANEYGFEFIDIYTPMMDSSTGEIYEEYTFDGAHLTPLGNSVLTELIKPTICEQVNLWEEEHK